MLVDLSVALNEKTPIYPGDPKTKIKISAVLEKDGYHDHYVSVGTHVGTHMDAPSHMIAGGKNLDEFPIESFSGRGVYIQTGKNFDSGEKKKKWVGANWGGGAREPFPIHRILLGNDILIIENLTNLGVLAGKESTIYAFPIKLQIDGAPVRVVAEVP